MNGDMLTDLDYGELLEAHAASGAPLTVATYAARCGSTSACSTLSDGKSHRVHARSRRSTTVCAWASYALSRTTLQRYPPGEALGFDELMLDLLDRGSTPAQLRLRRLLARHRPARRLRPREHRVRGDPGAAAARGLGPPRGQLAIEPLHSQHVGLVIGRANGQLAEGGSQSASLFGRHLEHPSQRDEPTPRHPAWGRSVSGLPASTARIGGRSPATIGAPHAMASSRLIGKLSLRGAETTTAAAW